MDISRQSLSVGIFNGFLQYFPPSWAILVQKLGEEKKLSKSVSGYFMNKKRRKNHTAIKLGGGGLYGLAIKIFFLRLKLLFQLYFYFYEIWKWRRYS